MDKYLELIKSTINAEDAMSNMKLNRVATT